LSVVVAQWVDLLASAYGWTDTYVLSRTLFQIQHYSKQITQRVIRERRIFANSVRWATQSKRLDFERYLKSLDPGVSSNADFGGPPSGIVVTEDF
jgi:hypothetical protein